MGLWLSSTESKNQWMQIFDELKARGLEDVFFISMDGVSRLEEGAKVIFPKVVIHLIRNSIKYISSIDYNKFTASIKRVYSASSLKVAQTAFESFQNEWGQYPGAIDVWVKNFKHVEQLFNYGSSVRKIMYTTNAIEAVNSSFRKVTKKGTFPNKNTLFKFFYLRIKELNNKWEKGYVPNWSMVLNQLMIDDKFKTRID